MLDVWFAEKTGPRTNDCNMRMHAHAYAHGRDREKRYFVKVLALFQNSDSDSSLRGFLLTVARRAIIIRNDEIILSPGCS